MNVSMRALGLGLCDNVLPSHLDRLQRQGRRSEPPWWLAV